MGPIGLGNHFQPTSIMRWDRGIFNGSDVKVKAPVSQDHLK